jgi:hypothetical protein
MTQQLVTYVLLGGAIVYLGYKFLLPKKKKGKGDKNCDNCG